MCKVLKMGGGGGGGLAAYVMGLTQTKDVRTLRSGVREEVSYQDECECLILCDYWLNWYQTIVQHNRGRYTFI